MSGEIWREDGYHGAVYVVYPAKTDLQVAISDTARIRKIRKADLVAVDGWTYKGELYIGKVAPAEKATKKTVVMQRG